MTEEKKASLTVLGGPMAGARCELPDVGTITVGSAEGSGLHLALPGVSPLHLRVVVDAEGVTVHEVGPAGRAHVNDGAVGQGGTPLHNGDVIWIGTPGESDAVMLQCHLPRGTAEVPVQPPLPFAWEWMPAPHASHLSPTGPRPAAPQDAAHPPGLEREGGRRMAEPRKRVGSVGLPVSVGAPKAKATSQQAAWQKLWIEARGRPWTTLAVIPAMPGHEVRVAASQLAEVGSAALASDVTHEAAEGLTLEESHLLLERLDASKRLTLPTIVSLDSPLSNRAALLVARHADAALLVVPIEACPLARARETVKEVGVERFVGTLVVRPQ